jgi:gamma-glutamylputrescine oxidase
VVVLGGGIAGCSAALHLAQRGYRVALLEARVVGYGASGRSGGQTIFGLAASQKR